jgi:hypothetical protein
MTNQLATPAASCEPATRATLHEQTPLGYKYSMSAWLRPRIIIHPQQTTAPVYSYYILAQKSGHTSHPSSMASRPAAVSSLALLALLLSCAVTMSSAARRLEEEPAPKEEEPEFPPHLTVPELPVPEHELPPLPEAHLPPKPELPPLPKVELPPKPEMPAIPELHFPEPEAAKP